MKPKAHTPALLVVWILFCVFCNCAGWLLSAAHQLNAPGYAAAFLAGFAAVFFLRKQWAANFSAADFAKLKKRFRRKFPLAFLILAALEFLGGAMHPPTNFDALAYRVPRVLHWLAENQWHWIHSDYSRLNTRGVGIEWLSAPLIAFTQSDRALFLINVISLLLLPGLIFSLFRRLGVRQRTAWRWMWIAPTGYCFLLQTGGIANDLFCAVFALAAVDFALRARESNRAGDFWLSMLSAALLTGSKANTLPLLLPCAIALLPSLKFIVRRPVAFFGVCMVSVACSFLPIAFENWKHCGDWSGLSLEGLSMQNAPGFRLAVNAVAVTVQNLAPPVFPFSGAWQRLVQKALPVAMHDKLVQNFDAGLAHFHIGELQVEDHSGLGFGVCVLVLVSWLGALLLRKKGFSSTPNISLLQRLLLLSPFVALFVLLAKSGLEGITRVLAPFYLLLLPIFLISPAQEILVRRKWWLRASAVVFLMAGALVVVSPERPLLPVNALLQRAHAETSHNSLLRRVNNVYSAQRSRWDAFASIREKLPPDATTLGLICYHDLETSLWRPFGSRRIEYVKREDTPEALCARGISYILVNSETLQVYQTETIDQWASRMNAAVVERIPFREFASREAIDWYLIRLRAADAKPVKASPSA